LSEVKKKKICDSHVPYNTQEQNSLFVIQDHIKEGVGGSCLRKGFAMFFSTIIPNKGYFSTISDKNFSYIQIIFSRRKGCFKGLMLRD
jgi:predicted transcriptional regulator with HTH domain